MFLLSRLIAISFLLSGVCHPAKPQSLPRRSSDVLVRVCNRPLPKWSGSRNWLLTVFNRIIVRHVHHSYISFDFDLFVPGLGGSIRTIGIHPVEPGNRNKQPIPDQDTDRGGHCKAVQDVTTEKMDKLAAEIARDTCYSCGREYHNRVLSGCFNNSNSYVYDLISGAGRKWVARPVIAIITLVTYGRQ